MKEQKNNIFGILSIVFSLLIPLFGIAFGIGAIIKKEKCPYLGVIGITISITSVVVTTIFLILV